MASEPLIPDPVERPTVTVPVAAKLLGIGRASAYQAAKNGDIPTIRIGGRVVVPTAALRRLLTLDEPLDAA